MGTYDVIVVGGGVVGTATAREAAQRGLSALLLERGTWGHSEGSSAGESRIIRMTYSADHYSRLMESAYARWRELEEEERGSGSLLVGTGLLCYGPARNGVSQHTAHADANYFAQMVASAAKTGTPLEALDAASLAARFPGAVLPDDEICVYSKDGGVLRASKCVEALRESAERAGATAQDRAEVIAIRPPHRGATAYAEVQLTDGTVHRAHNVIMACGGWAPAILERDFGLRVDGLAPYCTGVSYWELSPKFHGKFDATAGAPNFIDYGSWKGGVYGCPSFEHPGLLKMCTHVLTEGQELLHEPRGNYKVANMDDTAARFGTGESSYASRFREATRKLVTPWLQAHFAPECFSTNPPTLKRFEPCIYTMTPDHDFVLAEIGSAPSNQGRIVLCSPCSGHGFKLAPITAAAALALATAGEDAAAKVLRCDSTATFRDLFGLQRLKINKLHTESARL